MVEMFTHSFCIASSLIEISLLASCTALSVFLKFIEAERPGPLLLQPLHRGVPDLQPHPALLRLAALILISQWL